MTMRTTRTDAWKAVCDGCDRHEDTGHLLSGPAAVEMESRGWTFEQPPVPGPRLLYCPDCTSTRAEQPV